ncbi:MOSC domain-containing protein [Mammaliicoccus sciuri]|nr:hypothetical protein [Mammaliicoccus sciuri]
MADSYRTGCYFRVLKEGYVSQNDNMRLIEQTEPKLSIYELNETRFNDSKNLQRIDNILNHEAINDETREIFTKLRKRLS